MATLANYFPQNSSTAIIVPGDKPITITYQSLSDQCARFRRKLAAIGIGYGSAVSIALPNSLEFIVRIACLCFKSLTAVGIISGSLWAKSVRIPSWTLEAS